MLNLENGKFVLYNTLPNRLPHINFPDNVKSHYCLLFLTLVHIFMSGGSVTEGNFEQNLKNKIIKYFN